MALDVWMLPLGEEICNFDIDQPLLFVNTHAFHKWTENIEPQKKFINKKPGEFLELSLHKQVHTIFIYFIYVLNKVLHFRVSIATSVLHPITPIDRICILSIGLELQQVAKIVETLHLLGALLIYLLSLTLQPPRPPLL